MPTSEENAFALLRNFGMLEFTLKRTSGFLAAEGDPATGRRCKAKVDWPAVDRAVAALPANDFLDQISERTRLKLLGENRDRPKVQYVRGAADEAWHAEYEFSALPTNDAEAVVVAMRRARNNLFHGGKEDPLAEPYPGDDDEWVEAAREIAELLLDLLDRQLLRPIGGRRR